MQSKELVAISPIKMGFSEFEHAVNQYFGSKNWRVIRDHPKIIMANSFTKQVIPNENFSIHRTKETLQLRRLPN